MIRRAGRGASLIAALVGIALLGAAPSSATEPSPTRLPAVPGAESEPNDSPASASAIASGERVRGDLLAAGDVDYYRFSARAGERVFATVVTSATAGSSTDSELTLLGSDGTTVIEYDDNDGSQLAFASSIAGASIPSDGTYFLEVKNYGSEAATELPYDLYLQTRSGSPTPETEPNNTPETADSLASGFVSGARNPASGSEVDWYSLQLEAGDTVFLSLDLDPERDETSFNGRLGLGLTGDGENKILAVDDPGESESPHPTIPSEELTMTVSESGTYYAYVDSASAAAGGPTATYDLSATVLPASQPTCRSYKSWLSGDFFDGGSLTYPIEVEDAARIARAAVSLDLEAGVMADLDVSLRNPAGDELPLFTDIGATATGGQEHMEAVFDEFAAIPPAYAVLRPLMLQPEIAGRLNWLQGEQAQGEWAVVVRDDNSDGSAGAVDSATLILCPEAEEEIAETLFSAGFESGDEGFTHTGVADEWERGTPAIPETRAAVSVAGIDACAHGSACFKTDLDGTYESESSQDLVSPPISLAGVTGPIEVSWEQWYQLEGARFDHAVVSVEESGGGEPRPLFTWTGPTMTSTLGNPVTNPYHPAVGGWGRHRADISEYAGKTIRLRFHLDSDDEVNLAGLAIDDIRVFRRGTPPEPEEPGAEEGPPASEQPASEQPRASLPARTLTGLKVKPKRFRAAKRGPSGEGKARIPGGATVVYRDSLAGTVKITVRQAAKGHGGRFVTVGSFRRHDAAGVDRFHFSGRLRGRSLRPGRYRLEIRAPLVPGASSAGATASTPFTVGR